MYEWHLVVMCATDDGCSCFIEVCPASGWEVLDLAKEVFSLKIEPVINDENLANVTKTKHPKKGEKNNKMEGPKSRQKEEITNGSGPWGEHEHLKYNPLITRNIWDKERGGTLERTLGLKEPSLIVTKHLEIKATCVRYNPTHTLCLWNECKTKRGRPSEPFVLHIMLAHRWITFLTY